MGSITGMNDISATNISNSGEFRLGNTIDSGTAGQVIHSGGPNQPASWGPNGVAVPNALPAGTNITYTSGNPTWDGSVADTINSTDTTYQGGDNITIDTTTNPDTIDLDKTLTDMTSIQFNNTGTSTSLIGSNYYMNPRTPCSYLDLESSTNLILPPNVYNVAGSYHMAFSQGVWMPNDDSSYYNYAIEDDFTAPLVAGRGKVLSSSLELEGFFNIPNGWRATGIFIDLRGSTGFQVSRSISIYEVKTWSSSNPISSTYTYLGGTTTNTQYTFSTTMDGQIDNAMWVEVSMASTADYIAGGYIILTKI